MKHSTSDLGRYTRLALLLVMLAAQGIAVAHDTGDHRGLQSDPCFTCIIGHGLGTAVGASHETPAILACRPFAAAEISHVTLTLRTNGHLARAPPLFYRHR